MRNADDVAPPSRMARWARRVNAIELEALLKLCLLASSATMGLFTGVALAQMAWTAVQSLVAAIWGWF